MKPLALLPGKNATNAFNAVLDAAYCRAKLPGNILDEPHFVRELITDETIIGLNTAASNTYDENINSVRFAGGFLHWRPYAKFTATNAGGAKICTRELADAMVVLNETQPNGSGIHGVVRRTACLLMFKTKDANNPKCPKYDASGSSLPGGSDKEQFHLFSAWPSFELLDGSGSSIGNFSIQQPVGSPNLHSHGKFGALWAPTSKKTCGWASRWRYADPIPSAPIVSSMGLLLSNMVNADPNDGREYDSNGVSSWDKLIVALHGFAVSYNWGSAQRAANPAGLSFLQARDIVDINLGTIAQHIRSAVTMHKQPLPDWLYLLEDIYLSGWARPRFNLSESKDGMPILFITVSSFRPSENTEPIDPDSRVKLITHALRKLGDIRWRGN